MPKKIENIISNLSKTNLFFNGCLSFITLKKKTLDVSVMYRCQMENLMTIGLVGSMKKVVFIFVVC
jgi:hypothetical protein